MEHMHENIRIGIANQIPGLSEKVDTFLIGNELKVFFEKIRSKINLNDLNDWKLKIAITLRSTDGVGVFKKTRRYPSDKEFELPISIAIPGASQAAYGLVEAEESFFLPLDSSNFYIIKLNFEEFSNLRDYIFNAGVQAIETAFTKGFVCAGKKIKFQ